MARYSTVANINISYNMSTGEFLVLLYTGYFHIKQLLPG